MSGAHFTNRATFPVSVMNILEFYSYGLYNTDLNPKTVTHCITKFRSTQTDLSL